VDVETSEAIERINDSLVELRTELHDGFASVRTELRNELKDGLASVRTELRTELKDGLTSVRTEIADLRAELRAEIREGVAEAKLHGRVLYGSMQDNNRLLAEGFATLSAKIEKTDKRRR
jgi:hypothetical protein